MSQSSLANRLLEVMTDYETEWQQKLQAVEERVQTLERENAELSQQIETPPAIWEDIADATLRERLIGLKSSPFDTMIREAGVVLEDKLRTIAGLDSRSHGVNLVDAVLAPKTGKFIFSEHEGEQQGIHLLYRGAIQFIRNPPMHKLIEYPEDTAHLLLHLIDLLIQLLSEGTSRDQISVNDVRQMLIRRHIPEAQQKLYQALYAAGDKGLSASELAQQINCTPAQFAGVLGALGRRINNSKGLIGKGGVTIILDITQERSGEWHYCMRPILRDALKAEGII